MKSLGLIRGMRLGYEQMFALDELEFDLRELEARKTAWLVKVRAYDRSGEWATRRLASGVPADGIVVG